MIRFDPQASIRPTSDAKAFLDYLKERQIFQRAVDGYAFAAALALAQDLKPTTESLKHRSDLVNVSALDEDVRLALAASLQNKADALPFELAESSSLLNAFVYFAESGCEALESRWKDMSRSQMMNDLSKILTSN